MNNNNVQQNNTQSVNNTNVAGQVANNTAVNQQQTGIKTDFSDKNKGKKFPFRSIP